MEQSGQVYATGEPVPIRRAYQIIGHAFLADVSCLIGDWERARTVSARAIRYPRTTRAGRERYGYWHWWPACPSRSPFPRSASHRPAPGLGADALLGAEPSRPPSEVAPPPTPCHRKAARIPQAPPVAATAG